MNIAVDHSGDPGEQFFRAEMTLSRATCKIANQHGLDLRPAVRVKWHEERRGGRIAETTLDRIMDPTLSSG